VARRARQVARLVSAALPCGVIAAVVAVRHVSLISEGFSAPNFLMCPLASSSTWACPGPWQLSHPKPAAGDRGFLTCPCNVLLSVLASVV
jgi:hypothetical protein